MIINHSLASLFLRQGKEKVKQQGWSGFEEGIMRPSDFGFADNDSEEDGYYIPPSKRALSGLQAIRLSMEAYERLASPFTYTVQSWGRREFKCWPVRSDTLNACNLACTYFISALSEIFRDRMGDEPSALHNSRAGRAYTSGRSFSEWLKKDDVLRAFDVAEASLKAQVRSYPFLASSMPFTVKQYKDRMFASHLSIDKLLENEARIWDNDRFDADDRKRKITVQHENEEAGKENVEA
jgi:hypothetical protein